VDKEKSIESSFMGSAASMWRIRGAVMSWDEQLNQTGQAFGQKLCQDQEVVWWIDGSLNLGQSQVMDLYQTFVRPLLFSGLNADPEWLHTQAINLLKLLAHRSQTPGFGMISDRLYHSYSVSDPRLSQTLWGVTFPNPLGLAAGFDKNGEIGTFWRSFGFGYAEVGTVTWHAQPGNPKPRMFRLIDDLASLNRMGFNNVGAIAMVENLQLAGVTGQPKAGQTKTGQPVDEPNQHPASSLNSSIPIGINLGKSKITPLEQAAADYRQSFEVLQNFGDYFVVNVSSPNTPGLRSLQEPERLAQIFDTLTCANVAAKPILVKIAPDLEWEAIAAVVKLAQAYQLAGIIATNTTIARDGLKTKILRTTGKPVAEEAGGLAGAPLRSRSTEIIRQIYAETEGKLPIIGVGGIFTAEDAWEKITAGASLLQVYTGWIYEGPLMAKRMMLGLLEKLDESGLDRLEQAVGLAHRS